MREDWIECTLNDIAIWGSGGTPKSTNSEFYNGDIPWLIIGDLNDGYVKSSEKSITKLGLDNSSAKLVQPNSVLIAMYGSIGKLGINSIEVATNQAIAFTKFLPAQILNNYLFHYLFFCRPKLHAVGKGGTQKNISQTVLKQFAFPLIPLPEQRAIVAKIEELFSDLDKGIADLKKAQDQLKIYRQAVLKKAFEGELTKEWRNNNALEPSFNFLKEIVKERKEAEVDKKSIYHKKISHEFEFSQDTSIKTWSKGTLDKLIYIAARIGWRGLKKSEYTEEGPLFLSVHSLNHGKYVDYTEAYHISEERYIESPEIKLQEGDVLLCKDGAGIGKIGIVKDLPRSGSVNSSLLVIRGMNILSQEFIYYLFSGPKLQSIVSQRITGSATPHLFQNDIRKFELLIPPLEEQHQIVQEIESRLSVCDKVEESITESLEKAKALRQSILKKAFEGTLLSEEEIAACKAAPDYEPASVLLEKIKAEKKK